MSEQTYRNLSSFAPKSTDERVTELEAKVARLEALVSSLHPPQDETAHPQPFQF
jgi:BMFP domain-containing protein YqiC